MVACAAEWHARRTRRSAIAESELQGSARGGRTNPASRLLNEFEVADRLGVSVDTLRAARGGRGELARLPYVKLPGRLIRYEEEDVEAIIEAGHTSGRRRRGDPPWLTSTAATPNCPVRP